MARFTDTLKRARSATWLLTRESVTEWSRDSAPRLGAALSYYTVFALAPVLVLMIAVASFFFGAEAAQGQVADQLRSLLGEDAAADIENMVLHSSRSRHTLLATLIGILTLLIGATGVMVELKAALDTAWKVKPKPGHAVKTLLRSRLVALGLVVGMGFLLLASLLVNAALAWLDGHMQSDLPAWIIVAYVVDETFSLVAVALLFALILKLLPDAKVSWRDALIGSVVTSLLFHVGTFLIGLYIGRASPTSAFGAAGSLAVLLVWVYYSAQIVLLGAEFTRSYADHFGSRVVPKEHAVATQSTPHSTVEGAESAAYETVSAYARARARDRPAYSRRDSNDDRRGPSGR